MFEYPMEDPSKCSDRTKSLIGKFHEHFPQAQIKWVVRAPGRVNILGEHIDYCGYGVLPMALSRDTMILATSSHDDNVHLRNTKDQFKPCNFNPNTLDIDKEEFSWAKYVMCGLYALKTINPSLKFQGLNILVDGNIPLSCGLSSSSSLVVCSALIFCIAHDVKIKKDKFADICAQVERYIGSAGGGMDQAISCLAQKGMAKHIMFNPLRTENVFLPKSGVIVVANSVSTCDKALTPQYNTRVVECRIGVRILTKCLKLDNPELIKIPIDLEEHSKLSKGQLVELVKQHLKVDGYTQDEIMKILDINKSKLHGEILTPNTIRVTRFYPRQRLLHVFTETERVDIFVTKCKSLQQADNSQEVLSHLGLLMNESHSSCKDLYDCSSPDQDKMVEVMRKNGCHGARMTGAGWGGCVVALISAKSADKFIKDVKQDYYKDLKVGDLDELIFISEPEEGAHAYHLEYNSLSN
ncbi:hypothetical protein GJ496_004226 [Pomphorhynchus laevis]|nr:hypothetical protein GJ496_004226 [Pomphorhynchus laevis]